MQPELKVRKILGRTYLNENRLAEALDIFVKILADYPDDLETLLILGGFYLAGGDGKTAKSIYLRAQQLDPKNTTIERQIAMAEQMECPGSEEPVPTDMDAVARLLQRLTGAASAVQESDILRAANLLDKIVNSENPGELVSVHLDEIDELLLALIELNVRQAHADGRADIAGALRSLQLNIDYQLIEKGNKWAQQDDNVDATQPQFTGRLLLLLPDVNNKSKRMATLSATLESCGCQVIEKEEYIPGRDVKPDVVITGNPHTNPALIDSLSALSDQGVPIILDLDADFAHQPVSHREYSSMGLSTQARSDAYRAAISLADLISVPSEIQAASLRRDTTVHVQVIPDGWSRRNKLWAKDAAPRSTVNIGWVGSSGQLEDLMNLRRFIVRIVREFSNVRIVIVGDPQAYRLFDGLPENRRLYLPLVAHEEFPYLLGQLDILLVPLRNQPYNLSLSDTILVEAGAKGVPWIASPIPAFRDWTAGGIISESFDDEWHLNLRHLVMDEKLRKKLGEAGRKAAAAREMDQLGQVWLETLVQVVGVDSRNKERITNAI